MDTESEILVEKGADGDPMSRNTSATVAPKRTRLPKELLQLQSKHRQRIYLRFLMVFSDVLAISIAFVAANFLRFGDPAHDQGLNMAAVLLPIYLVTAVNNHAYSIACLIRARAGATNAIMAFLLTLSAVGLVIFFLQAGTDFSRAVFGIGASLAVCAIPLSRFILSRFARSLFGPSTLNEIVIRDGIKVRVSPGSILLDAQRYDLSPRLDDPAMLDRLGRFVQNTDRVIVACPPERRWLWTLALRGADVRAEVFAPELEDLGPLAIERYDGRHTLVIAAGPLALADRILKRTFDIMLTLIILPVILPVMALTAIAIRFDSPGPIIFAQDRVGLGNRLFRMYKFRSMYVDLLDGAGSRSTERNDGRTTRVGRFIRATSLDELPQFFNVLSGAMSIVGPRPHALGSRAEDKLFWDIDTAYWHRHSVKPGLTGLAQIRGYRGATETISDLSNRLQADLEYLSGWSIWRDLSIIIATFRVMIHRNAF